MPGTTAYYRLVELAGTVELDVSDPVRVLSVTDVEYHLEDQTVPGIDFDTSLFGVVRYPSDMLAGPFPLVVFLHGNHGNCRDLVTQEDVCITLETQTCDEPGFETAPNAHGHVYLQETLAAQGFVTVSLGANALGSRSCRLRPGKQAVRTTWNGPANTHIDLLNLDSSGFDTLSVRFSSSPQVGPLDPGVTEHDFTIRISDTQGESAEVSLSSVGRLAHGYPRANPVLIHDVLSTVRVPLATFVAQNPALDLSQLKAVEFVFPGNGSSTGGVWLSDLQLVSDCESCATNCELGPRRLGTQWTRSSSQRR